MKFSDLLKRGIYQFRLAFDVFNVKLGKVILFFVVLNLLMFIPITSRIVSLDEIDYTFFGMDFHENVPEFIEDGFPESCIIINYQLDCGMDNVFVYELTNNDKTWMVYFNVSDDQDYNIDHSVVFYKSNIVFQVNESSRFILDYGYFNNTSFEQLNQMNSEDAYMLLIDNLFMSLKDVFLLPAVLFVIVALLLMNAILLVAVSSISMMFKFNQSDFPSYKNMIKLFLLASTIPSLINVILGFLGLFAFTTIVYNILTPIIAFFMYRQSRIHLEIRG